MKKLLGIILILIAFVFGSYYGMGVITEKTLKKNVKMVNQASNVFVSIKSYDRGWFTSNALFEAKIHVDESVKQDDSGKTIRIPAQDYTLDIPLAVIHGPIIYSPSDVKFGLGYARTAINLPPEVRAKLDEAFETTSTLPIFEIGVFVSYTNKTYANLDIPPFVLVAKEKKGQWSWLGMESTYIFSSDLEKISGQIDINGFNLVKPAAKFIVGKIKARLDMHQEENKLYVGDLSLKVPSILLREKDKDLFKLDKLAFSTESDVKDGLFATCLKISLKHVAAEDKNYGPGEFKLKIKNIDAKVLSHINEQLNKSQDKSDTERQQMTLSLLPELPKLLGRGAVVDLEEASIIMPEGKALMQLKLMMAPGEITNPFQIIQRLKGDGKVVMPKSLVLSLLTDTLEKRLQKNKLNDAIVKQMKQEASDTPKTPVEDIQAESSDMTVAQKAKEDASQQLDAMVKQGIIMVNGDELSIDIRLDNGRLTVNGRPFNPAMLGM